MSFWFFWVAIPLVSIGIIDYFVILVIKRLFYFDPEINFKKNIFVFAFTFSIQLLFLIYFWSVVNISSAATIILPGVIAATYVVSIVLGFVLILFWFLYVTRETAGKLRKSVMAISAVFILLFMLFCISIWERSHFSFYLKVIDQHNQPVSDVQVKYSVKSSSIVKRTNKDGMLKIREHGSRFNIISIEKAGYSIKLLERYFKNFGGNSEDKPYLIKSWKAGPKKSKLKAHKTTVYLKTDGRPYTIKFTTELKRWFKSEGLHEGDIVISILKQNDDYVTKLKAINGGLIETDDVLLYQAPLDGYQPMLTHSIKASKLQREDKTVFYVSQNKKYYGVFKMQIQHLHRVDRHGENRKSRINFDYTVNLSGNRELVSSY